MTNEKLISIWFNDITERPFNKSEKTRDTYAKEIKYFFVLKSTLKYSL